ncbi:hypothetical protein HUT16_34960 [Kitasatospora sp. NA04385]|uniref:HAAS signaling domain-containing protein n=1 Tax=Kitasatospora sp. NA04385 TaxID=2742135 RepID=UPI00158FA9C6|nr:hypothetical protein [Kitasatospora sp. NA04385]QKW23607.1 hypothetical protein HUT16_34960 [Kitasatospora sp. NA04385]
MSNAAEHPLVRAHLAAVERCTASLPPERRRELLADLREHVQVALAEHDGPVDDDAVRHVLDELGSPRRIADAALAEEGRTCPEPESGLRTATTLTLLALAAPLLLVPVLGPYLAPAAAATGAVRLARSPQWSGREKKHAALLLLGTLPLTPLAAFAVSVVGALDQTGMLLALAIGFCPALLAVLRLARSAGRLRSATAPA